MSSAAATPVDPLRIVTALIEMGHVDTVYRDVYLERARSVLGGVLSLDEFRFLEKARRDLAELSLSIARALERADWPLVKQLAARTQALRESVEGKQKLIETARDVYAVRDVSLDPFSPGLQTFTRVATSDLPALRDRTIKRLTALEEADAVEREFYAARRAALQELVLDTAEATSAAPGATSAGDAREAASRALKAGDMKGLEKLAGEVMGRPVPERIDRARTRPPRARRPDRLGLRSTPVRISSCPTPAMPSPGRGSSGSLPAIWNPGQISPRSAGMPGIRCSRTSQGASRSRSYHCRRARPRASGIDWRCS